MVLYLFGLAAAQCQSHLIAGMHSECIGSPFNRSIDKHLCAPPVQSRFIYLFSAVIRKVSGSLTRGIWFIRALLSLAIWGVNYFLF